mmetsp:Transcript_95956/g.150104  ORF Transcript_95956/g.150104 Transcript_95956/m.150104 type:complete len:130 (-) Transcript_95956:20-409(-)
MLLATIPFPSSTHLSIPRQFHMAETTRGLVGGTPSQVMVSAQSETPVFSLCGSLSICRDMQMEETSPRSSRTSCSWRECSDVICEWDRLFKDEVWRWYSPCSIVVVKRLEFIGRPLADREAVRDHIIDK